MGDLIKRLWRWLWQDVTDKRRRWLIVILAFLITYSLAVTVLALLGAF
jgi:hypothetical protein